MNKTSLFIFVAAIVVVIIAGGAIAYLKNNQMFTHEITNFEECAAAGNPVGESYPRQCWTKDGRHFVEEIKQQPVQPSEAKKVIISGKIICLPKIGQGEQTLECAIGLQGDNGKNYGLRNLSDIDPQHKLSQTGLPIQVTGVLKEEEMNGPGGSKYDVVGIIYVEQISTK